MRAVNPASINFAAGTSPGSNSLRPLGPTLDFAGFLFRFSTGNTCKWRRQDGDGNIAKEHIHTLMHAARKTITLMQTQKRTNNDIPILTQHERHLQEVVSQEDRYNAFFENKKSKKRVIMEMKAEVGKLCMDAAISLHAKETSKKRKRSSAESPEKSDNDEVLTTQARKAADAQVRF